MPKLWRRSLALLLAAASAFGQSRPVARARLIRPRVHLDEPVEVVIDVSWTERAGRSFRLTPPRAPRPKKLRLERVAEQVRTEPAPGGARHRVRFLCRFKPLEPGDAETGPIEVRYVSTDLAQIIAGSDKNADGKQYFTARVKSLRVRVVKGVPLALWIVLAALALVLLAAGGALAAGILRRKRPQAEAAQADAEPLEKQMLDRLHALRTLRIEGETKTYVGRVADLLAEYVREKFQLDALDADRLAGALGESEGRRLAALCDEAEKIRYAGAPPSEDDLNRIARFAEDLLRRRLPQTDPLDPARPKN